MSCLSVQDFASSTTSPPDAQANPSLDPSEDATPRHWEWANPAPSGDRLNAINGTSDSDIWVAGDGIIAHFDGNGWDKRRFSPDGLHYFAVGTRGPSDVWVAGGAKDQTHVVHFDGTTWTESYPFAGAAFGGFSHGAGKRLFAIVDLGILELSPEGAWQGTEVGTNLLDRGAVVDIWAGPMGDAWAITTGAMQAPTLLHLEPDAHAWTLAGPDLPAHTTGLSLSGAGAFGCAFYTGGNGAASDGQDGIGFLFYDQKQWLVGVRAAASVFERPTLGATSACVRGGLGYIVGGHDILEDSLDGKIDKGPSTELGITKNAAWSFDGQYAYVVGDRGLLLRRAWDDDQYRDWEEPGPTIRNDLLDVDVGEDGTVMAVDALRTISPHGGEVLSWNDRWTVLNKRADHVGPPVPVAITVIDANNAWIASDEDGHIGVTHFAGQFDAAATLIEGTGADKDDAIAMWAPAANDVWLTGRERCPDASYKSGDPCSKPLAAMASHFDGNHWTTFRTEGSYFGIHGSGPNDVWFAGEGVAHWDGKTLAPVAALPGPFAGVWSSVKDRVWLWGSQSVLFDGATTTPVERALNASAEWKVAGIAESAAGDVFVLTTRSTGTTLLWFDPTHTRLVEQLSSDLNMTKIRGRGTRLWAVGAGGASVRFAPAVIR